MHYFCHNAVTGDIPLISLVLKSMIPLSTCSKRPGLLGYIFRLVALTVCVIARLCWASTGTGGGKRHCLRPQCLQRINHCGWIQWSRHDFGILSHFPFFSLIYIYTRFLFSCFPQLYKISAIYSVNGSQETRETWNISPRVISIVNG